MFETTLHHQVNQVLACDMVSSRSSGRAKCEKGWNWHPPFMPDYDLWYVVSGQGAMQLNGETHLLSAGTCILLRPGDRIAAEQQPYHRLTVIFLHFQIKHLADPSIIPNKVTIHDTYWFEQLLNRMLSVDEMQPTSLYNAQFSLLMKSAICHILQECHTVYDRTANPNKSVQQMVKHIKENIAVPLEHDELAALVNLSPRYASMLFKQQMGISLKSFIARSRIERASHLLTESTMNISQIAETLGYNDIYFFSKQFKQFIGESPTHYRRRTRAADSHYGHRS